MISKRASSELKVLDTTRIKLEMHKVFQVAISTQVPVKALTATLDNNRGHSSLIYILSRNLAQESTTTDLPAYTKKPLANTTAR